MNHTNPTQIIHDRNELIQGPAPECLQVMRTFPTEKVFSYPDGYYGSTLVPVLAQRYGLAAQNIIISSGAEGLLEHIFNWLKPGETVLTQYYRYRYYTFALKHRNVELATFAMHEGDTSFTFDVEDCIRQLKALNPRLLLLTSPNNPTGNVLSIDDLQRILKNVGPETLVILDEAYWGFDTTYNEQAMLDILHQTPNLILARTFSKYYGLAGLRMGYALCGSNVINLLHYQPPFLGFCRIAEAMCLAALDAQDYYKTTAQQVISERERIITELTSLPHVKVFHSQANMVLTKLTEAADAALSAILPTLPVVTIRKDHGTYWRISVGTEALNTPLLKVLKGLPQ
ncbi:MAG: aminotransferase class I/II-fold pyridoxal phosphate-dependent enzyme [Alphaproteobacteria bacterium]